MNRISAVLLPMLCAFFAFTAVIGLIRVEPTAALGVIRYVVPGGSGDCSQGAPCALQTAVSLSSDDDEVRVAAGTYFTGTPILLITKTITVTGGYDSANWSAQPNPLLNPTILDGQNSKQVVRIIGVISPTIQGFVIRNGRSEQGAGVYNQSGQPRLSHNEIHDNNATNAGGGVGGGIYDAGSAIIEYNRIHNNLADQFGAGISIDNGVSGGLTTIRFNHIYSNTTIFGGGISMQFNNRAFIEGNEIYNNTATDAGAGFLTSGNATEATALQNNFIYNNDADSGGGIFVLGQLNLLNNTIAGNDATTDGGGIFVDAAASVRISNTIVVSNTGGGDSGISNDSGGSVTGDYNNIFGNTSDATFTNTVAADPQFINFSTFNLHLRSGSPNEDAGDPATSPDIDIDIDGQTRPRGAAVDIGADEIYPNVASFTLTPATQSQIVDRGSSGTVTHTLENVGTVADGYSFTCSNDRGWTVTCPGAVSNLDIGELTDVQTTVDVPPGETGLTVGTTTITATSTTSPTLMQTAVFDTIVAPIPGVAFTPNFTATLLPGETITLTHALTNTGDSTDTFGISVASDPGGWAEILPNEPLSLTLASGASTNVQVRVTVPAFAAAGFGNTSQIEATSSFDPGITASVFNTVTARATVGTRFAAPGGDDLNNNCTQQSTPCATIERAVGQAAQFDEVRIFAGSYSEDELFINDTIYISGGWISGWSAQGDPDATTITPNGSTRLFNIAPGSDKQPSIENMTLSNGNGGFQGGAIFVGNFAQPDLTFLIMQNSQAGSGGALYVGTNSLVTISQTQFLSNTATTLAGGAIFINGGTAVIHESSFINNEATAQDGGAAHLDNGLLSATNTLFANNRAADDGGALSSSAGIVEVQFDTFVSNSAGGNGGAIFNNSADLTINSSMIVSNTAVTQHGAVSDGSGSGTLTYSNLFGNTPAPDNNVATTSNNISADPLFADAQYHLSNASPAIDAADPAAIIENDFEGDFRPSDQGFDIGYDEQPGCVVKRDSTIFGSIQAAIDMPGAVSDLIRVSGICRGVNTIVVDSTTISQTVHITETVTIQGGWNSDFTQQSATTPAIIDPEGEGRAVFVAGGTAVQPRLEMITLVNGDATGLGGAAATEDAGGGLYNLDASVTLIDVMMMTNTAAFGGGVFNSGGTLTMTGSMAKSGDDLMLPTLFGNSAIDGGAVYIEGGTATLNGLLLRNNTATDGAAVYLSGGVISVTNSVLANNSATGSGGGIYNGSTAVDVRHNTFYSNSASGNGGALYSASGDPTINSNIFESNSAAAGDAIFVATGSPGVNYNYYYDHTSARSGVAAGANDIEDNVIPPGLVDPANGDFHLADSAPAIDTGDPSSPILTDFEDDPRPSNQSTDIGADEVAGCRVRLNGEIYGSIQTAIAIANPGDVIDVAGVCSGVHEYDSGILLDTGCLEAGLIQTTVHINKNITLRGGWNDDFTAQDSVTTLDALELGHVVYVASGTSPTIEQFDIVNGLATGVAGNGGGICIDSASPTIVNNRIMSNTAVSGAGIFSFESEPVIKGGNRIISNTATDNGGGVAFESLTGLVGTLQNNFITNNAASNGGAIYSDGGNNQIWHNTIVANQAIEGAAIYVAADNPEIRGNLVVSNTASVGVGGAFGDAGTVPTLSYNDFFGNGTSFGGTIADGGTGAVSLDPLFTTDAYTLTIGSPVVDIADPTIPITEDFEMDIRPSHQGIDIGADEVGGCFAYVSSDPATIYGSAQSAVDAAAADETVFVDGTCYGVNTQNNGDAISVTQNLFVDKNLTIDGDWRSGLHAGTNLTATLDALDGGRGVYIDAGATVTLTNLTVTGGDAAGAGIADSGGGVYNAGTLVVDGVSLLENTAPSGGALFNAADLTLQGSIIASNSATNGAGVANNSADTALIRGQNVFRENIATGSGGALYLEAGDLTLDASVFTLNQADEGGAVYLAGGTTTAVNLTNNFIYENTATTGGGVRNADTAADILHNTLYNNTASGGTGGGIASAVTNATIRNNLVDLNTGSGIDAPGGTNIDYNNVVNNTGGGYSGGATAGGNDISQTPLYVSVALDNYHLQDDSPGIDVADPSSPLTSDYDGDVRPTNQGPDIGADELNSCLIRVISPADSSENIFGVVQDAIEYAESFAGSFPLPTVEVARGECRGVQSRGGTEQVAYVQEDLTFVGSLRRNNFSDPGDYDSDTVGTVSTLFNAEGNGRVLVVTGTAEVSFTHIGFVEGSGTSGGADGNGGAVHLNSSGVASFAESTFCDSSATNGGGIYGTSTSIFELAGVRVGSCLTANVTEAPNGSVQAVEYTFHDGNSVTNDGGGVYADGRFDLRNVSIYENQAANNGGGIFNNGSDNRLINATFYSNTAQVDGGGIYDAAGDNLGIYHNTFRENTAATGEGGAIWHNSASLMLNSSIVYSNTATTGGGLRSTLGTRSHNNFFANAPENIAGGTVSDPNSLVIDPLLSFTTLSIDSPVIDQADPDLLTSGAPGTAPFADEVIDYDRSNDLRPDDVSENTGIHGTGSDMGSDEYRKGFGCLVTPGSTSATAVPGQVVTYSFTLENQGRSIGDGNFTGYTDTLTVTLNSTQGWGLLGLSNPHTETLGFQESVMRVITVTVPATATTGLQDVSTLSCQSGSAPSMTTNGKATTSVGIVGGILVEPDYTDNVLPGDVITYEHTITNQGNATINLELNAASGPQHASAVLVNDAGMILSNTLVTLAPTESVTTLLRVTILDTGTAGEVASPGVIAVEEGNPSNFGAAQNQLTIGAIAGTRFIAKAGAADSTNCTDPANPCATIQHALEQALDNDAILLSTGTYTETSTQLIGGDLAEQAVYIDKSVTIRGGYDVADGFTTYAPITNAVTIDGEGVRRAFLITDGLTVTLSSLFVENSTAVTQAFDATRGGAVYNAGSNLVISGTWLMDNSARQGGALFHGGGDLVLINSVFVNNAKPVGDGGDGAGGAVYLDGGSNDIVNNTFVTNSADNNGAEVGATGSGGAIYAAGGSFDLINNIFDSNAASAGSRAVFIVSPTVTVNNDYNLYWSEAGLFDQINVVSGTNSFAGDPLYEDAFYHLSFDSAAKDAGTAVSITPAFDYESDARPNGAAVDIGADERLQRPDFVFAPTPLSATIGTGDVFTYTHILTNTGDAADSYTLTMTNTSIPPGGGFGYSLTPTATGTLTPGDSITATFVITGGLPGYRDVTEIMATAATAISRTVTDTTTISHTAGVDIETNGFGMGFPGQQVTFTHTLTNTGDGVDMFTLAPITTTAVPTGWLVTVTPTQTGFIDPAESIPFTVTVNVPPGTLSDTVHTIGIEATASDPFASDILTDTTTVGAAYGLTLMPDNSSTTDSDTTVVYTHTLQNVGNLTDTVALSFSSTPSWTVQVAPLNVTLTPLQTETVVVTVTVPADTGGLVHTAMITATSEGALTATAVNTTTVSSVQGVLIEPDSVIVDSAGATVQHVHTITNTGNVTDTFDLTFETSAGWLDSVTPISVTLGAGNSDTVTATVTIPALANPGDSDVTIITATSQITNTVFDRVTDTTRVGQVFDLEFVPNNTVTTTAGSTVTYTHTLTNTGNGTDSYTLDANSSRGWPVQLPTVPITLDAGLASPVVVTLTVPIAGAGLTDTVVITATSTISPAASAAVTNTTIVTGTPAILGVQIEPDNAASALPGDTVTYTHTVTNTGDVTDTFTLAVDSANGWTTTVDPTNLLLGPLEAATVTVTTGVPPGAPGGSSDQITVTVSSDADSMVSDTAFDVTTIDAVYDVILEPNNSGTADAGTIAVYTHVVTNTGNVTDTFTFTATSSNGWMVELPPNITLGAGLSATVQVSITIPAGASGLNDVTLVTAISTADSSANDFATDSTSVNGTPGTLGVSLTPNNAQTAAAGGNVQYLHTLENSGDTTDDYVITAVSSQGWALTVVPTSIRLTPGMTTTVLVRITVPGGAAGGTVDTTTVTAVSATDAVVSDSASDTTTVDGGVDPTFVSYLPLIVRPDDLLPPPPNPTPTPTATPTSTPPPTCTPTEVDLIVTEIRVSPAVPDSSAPATVFVTIRNQGSKNVTFGNNFFLDFYVDRVPLPVVAGEIAWGIQGSDMKAGASKTFSAPYTFGGGLHQLYAQVDTDNTVDECPREDNNVFGPVSLSVTGTAAQDDPADAPEGGSPRATPTPSIPTATPAPPRLTPLPTMTPTAQSRDR